MAYNPTVWQENDLASAERMNKIEQGIVSAFEAAAESGGLDIATIENETILTPTQLSELLGTSTPNFCVYLKNTTIKDVSFLDEIVFIHQYQDRYITKTDVYTQVGKKFTFLFDDWMNANSFYEVNEISVPTKQDVFESINDLENESALYSDVDNFFEIYGIEAESTYVSTKVSGGLAQKGMQVSKSDTMKSVITKIGENVYGYKYFYKKSTGEIIEHNIEKSTSTAIQLNVNNEVITPTPTPATFTTSFNGRSGAVTPKSGDYTAEMVGAIANANVSEITVLTEAEYDALTTKDATTLYLVKEEA